MSWVQLSVTAGLFIFLYFCLITSKLLYFQCKARCSEHFVTLFLSPVFGHFGHANTKGINLGDFITFNDVRSTQKEGIGCCCQLNDLKALWDGWYGLYGSWRIWYMYIPILLWSLYFPYRAARNNHIAVSQYWLHTDTSLIPRPCPAFHCLQYPKAWEAGYSDTMLPSKKSLHMDKSVHFLMT